MERWKTSLIKLVYDYKTRLAAINDIDTKEFLNIEHSIEQNNKLCATIILVKVSTATNSNYLDFFMNEVIEILTSNTSKLLIELVRNENVIYVIYQSKSSYYNNHIIQRAFYINTLQKMINKCSTENKNHINAAIVINSATMIHSISIYHHRTISFESAIYQSNLIANQIIEDNLQPIGMTKFIFNSYLHVKENHTEIEEWFDVIDVDEGIFYYNGNVIITEFNNWIENIFQNQKS